MKIRKDDNVLVIAGKDKGKKGKVRFAYPREQKVIVEGVNFLKSTPKPRGLPGRPALSTLKRRCMSPT